MNENNTASAVFVAMVGFGFHHVMHKIIAD